MIDYTVTLLRLDAVLHTHSVHGPNSFTLLILTQILLYTLAVHTIFSGLLVKNEN